MRLILSRAKKKKKLTRKLTFRVSAQVELTPDQKAVLGDLKLGREVLYRADQVTPELPLHVYRVWHTRRRQPSSHLPFSRITVDDLVNGKSVEFISLMDAIDAEKAVKSACSALQQLVMNAENFDGEAIHEF